MLPALIALAPGPRQSKAKVLFVMGKLNMLIIGERINTSRKAVNEAVEKRDAVFVAADVQRQVKAGADYIDVNAGSRIASEIEDMKWLVEIIEAAVDVPLTLDSPDPKVLQAIAPKVKQRPMINSTTAESNRFEAMKAVLQERECDIVALCMDDRGIPKTVEESLRSASFLVQNLTQLGIPSRESTLTVDSTDWREQRQWSFSCGNDPQPAPGVSGGADDLRPFQCFFRATQSVFSK